MQAQQFLPNQLAPPHPLRELLPYQSSWLDILLGFSIGLIIIAIAVACLVFLKKRTSKQKKSITIHPLAAIESELLQLQILLPFDAMRQKEFFFRLSLLLRQSIEKVFNIAATDLTFQELKVPLETKLPFSKDKVQTVLRFFKFSDLVKFAEEQATPEQAEQARAEVLVWFDDVRKYFDKKTGDMIQNVV